MFSLFIFEKGDIDSYSESSPRSKRFRNVSEQRKTKGQDSPVKNQTGASLSALNLQGNTFYAGYLEGFN